MCMWEGSLMPPEDMGPVDTKTVENVFRHCGAEIENQNTALVSDALRREIMGPNGFVEYMWFNMPDGGMYCTACGQEMAKTSAANHLAWMKCPACGKYVMARSARRSHKKLHQEFYAVQWQKSAVEKDALVMIGIYCGADYSRCEKAEKVIVPCMIDVFRYGKGAARYQRCVFSWEGTGVDPWHKKRDVRAIGTAYFGRKVDILINERSFERAIEGTAFEGAYDTITAAFQSRGYYRTGDHSEIVAAIARRPWIEYMAKAGFKWMATAATERMDRNLLNWRKSSVREIMRLSVDRYAELKGKRADISPGTLKVLQLMDAQGVRITLDEAVKLSRGFEIDAYTELFGRNTVDRALVKYLLKQKEDRGLLRDYWRMCTDMHIDLSDEQARLPRNIRAAHDRLVDIRDAEMIRRRNASQTKAAEDNQSKLDRRLPDLEKKYCFAANGLILRPARDLKELINEGNALRHCVGTYIARYAEGQTDILFLRRAEEPDKPWRTIEISPHNGRIIQDRGYKNDRDSAGKSTMTEELADALSAFWEAFEAARREKKARKSA